MTTAAPMWFLLALLLAAFLAAAGSLVAAPSRARTGTALALLVALGVTSAVTWATALDGREKEIAALAGSVPHLGRRAEGFTSSRACRACHPDQYASWYASFHRTMTTVATTETVRGRFDDVSLVNRGRKYELERRGGTFWVEMVDPEWERQLRLDGVDPDSRSPPPRVERQVVMTTGSHHMQTYWVASRHGREVYNLPFVFLFEADRWIPREDVFLRPPDAGRFLALWNNSCIDCHSTAGKVGFDFGDEVFDSTVAEMGIACEACHGPGEAHVGANRHPLRRYRLHLSRQADETIVQPERLPHDAASQVCGQCHGVSVSDDMDWLVHGHRYRAGDDLEATRLVVRPAHDRSSARMTELLRSDPWSLASRFWSDGMVRVSGREYNGMIESGCYRRGELSCLSCHSMHDGDPDDQLAAAMSGDAACTQCHDAGTWSGEGHTHHPAGSGGSRCYDCHMPHTTYGLLKAIRSHWIDSPSVASSIETGRPNACNLCHLDRTLAWTSEHLSRWYGAPPLALSPEERSVAAALLWVLRGDAGQRALVAWSMGWEAAWQASGRGWLAPYLASLLNDPYSTVRFIAERSLRKQPAFADLDYDFLGPAAERARAREAALDRWFELPYAGPPVAPDASAAPAILIDDAGDLLYDVIRRLASQRDDRPVFLAE